jgi:3-methyladenine DNA glycosylase AlkD
LACFIVVFKGFLDYLILMKRVVKREGVKEIKKALRRVANKNKAKVLARFFKTGKGEYGEGDKFLGVVVPAQRKIAQDVLRSRIWLREKRLLKTQLRTTLCDLQKLLQSSWHEERLTALLILVELYQRGDIKTKKEIYNFYLKNLRQINNWDLVDLSAPQIVENYLLALSEAEGFNFISKKQKDLILMKLAKSKNLWSRRVAVLATFPFIKSGHFTEILDLAEFLLFDQKEKHDLMHKAIGWMLREVGKRGSFDKLRTGKKVLIDFLNPRKTRPARHGVKIPRVTLRYAIEKMTEPERQKFLTL